MIFTSLTYIFFLILIVTIYWISEKKIKLLLIFFASIIFYGFWNFNFVPLLLFSIVINFLISKKIYTSREIFIKKKYLILVLVINLLILGIFKYFYFFQDNIINILNIFNLKIDIPYINIILPIGISFYTFQAISYSVDIYRGIQKPVKNFFLFADYIIFFPQLIAGPILRANEIIWQLDTRPKFKYSYVEEGSKRILVGLFLKLVIADNVAPFVDNAFTHDPSTLSPLDICSMAFLFGLQIYFDFSAYSHIAIGSAKLMGIKFPENFNFPYSSLSPKDFWKRWHISLSSWVRDYLYLPLIGSKFKTVSIGGFDLENQKLKDKIVFSLFLSWAIMGFWHGAGWNFIIWGISHAIIIYLFRLFPYGFYFLPVKIKIFFSWSITLTLIMLAWIPFRSETIGQTFQLWKSLFNFDLIFNLSFRENFYLITASLMLLVLIAPFVKKLTSYYLKMNIYILSFYNKLVIILLSMTIFIYIRPTEQFIYFQF